MSVRMKVLKNLLDASPVAKGRLDDFMGAGREYVYFHHDMFSGSQSWGWTSDYEQQIKDTLDVIFRGGHLRICAYECHESVYNLARMVIDFQTSCIPWHTYRCSGTTDFIVLSSRIEPQAEAAVPQDIREEEWCDISQLVLLTKWVQATQEDGAILANEHIPSELDLGGFFFWRQRRVLPNGEVNNLLRYGGLPGINVKENYLGDPMEMTWCDGFIGCQLDDLSD
ncbi:hypothetical protein ARMGADRAFT_1077706 [Armillaria gallica]|uniref:Uncharacterized protein n=1 Tax=Armillaria gallica TaxID=47427 RepID=A0A2H3DLU0_ARMGA|nr:hypothetical protein ARMGADRAFT_1077706 [Armillaria gallica]